MIPTQKTQGLYVTKRALVVRIVCGVSMICAALLVYPWLYVLIVTYTLIRFGGYEAIGAAIVFDAVVGSYNNAFGGFTYTTLTLIATILVLWARNRVRGM